MTGGASWRLNAALARLTPDLRPAPIQWDAFNHFLALFTFFWLLALVFHRYCCNRFQWYAEQVNIGSIILAFGRVYVIFPQLASPLQKIGGSRRMVRLWRVWFICGALFSSLLLLPTLLLLGYLLFAHHWIWQKHEHLDLPQDWLHSLTISPTKVPDAAGHNTLGDSYSSTSSFSPAASGLSPLIPGVNMPLNQAIPLVVAVLVSTIVHELGHGLAAAAELTEVSGVGLAIVGVFPAAFVLVRNLDAQELSRQLRILAAGVWHNLLLAALAAFLLLNLPRMLKPLFSPGKGVTVLGVGHDLRHANHSFPFHPGMEVYHVNNCSTSSIAALRHCSLSPAPQEGFCLSAEHIKRARDHFIPPAPYQLPGHETLAGSNHSVNDPAAVVLECCKNTSASLCFHGPPPALSTWHSNVTSHLAMTECLQVEKVRQRPRCNASAECAGPAGSEVCYRPFLLPSERILVLNSSVGPVVFVGSPELLVASLELSDYVTVWLHPSYLKLALWLTKWVQLSLQYLLSVSLGLALLNLVPCVGLDGQHILAVWLELLGRHGYLPRIIHRHHAAVHRFITGACSLLLLVNLLAGCGLV